MKRSLLSALILLGACASTSTETERTRIDRQLTELYRPLVALVEESRVSFVAFKKKEGREEIIPSDRPLTDAELQRWIDMIEKDLHPRNERMCALIRAKRDLADGPEPASWQALLDHQDSWRRSHEKWRKEGVAYPFHSPTNFPRSLERELKASIAALEERKASLK